MYPSEFIHPSSRLVHTFSKDKGRRTRMGKLRELSQASDFLKK
jgi:hypothetical protein